MVFRASAKLTARTCLALRGRRADGVALSPNDFVRNARRRTAEKRRRNPTRPAVRLALVFLRARNNRANATFARSDLHPVSRDRRDETCTPEYPTTIPRPQDRILRAGGRVFRSFLSAFRTRPRARIVNGSRGGFA